MAVKCLPKEYRYTPSGALAMEMCACFGRMVQRERTERVDHGTSDGKKQGNNGHDCCMHHQHQGKAMKRAMVETYHPPILGPL